MKLQMMIVKLIITMLMIMIIMIVMIKMIINDEDSNYDNVNEENGSQTIIFQIKHFRESFISEKPTFLVLSYV